MKKKIIPIFLSIAMLLIFASGSLASDVHWSYSEEGGGPENWGSLSPVFKEAIGSAQSPIDIKPVGNMNQVAFFYKDGPFSVINNGHTIQASPEEKNNSYILLGGARFYLQQLHFHTPSEHTLSGLSTPMEIHFVNRSDDGKLAVVGLFIDEGPENKAIKEIWGVAPKSLDLTPKKIERPLPLKNMLPQNLDGIRYDGSLTTPPTTEGVSWIIFSEHGKATAEQIRWFTGVIGNNARPTQPLNNRAPEPFQGQ